MILHYLADGEQLRSGFGSARELKKFKIDNSLAMRQNVGEDSFAADTFPYAFPFARGVGEEMIDLFFLAVLTPTKRLTKWTPSDRFAIGSRDLTEQLAPRSESLKRHETISWAP